MQRTGCGMISINLFASLRKILAWDTVGRI